MARFDGPLLQAGLLAFAERRGTCLRFIDPYGDTKFNQVQIPVVLDELESLDADC